MPELQSEVPGARVDRHRGSSRTRRRGAGRGVPASDPATEPREGEGAGSRAAFQRGPPGRIGARFVPRVRRPGRRDGGIAVEAGGALRPDARTAETSPGADGLPHRPRARSDQEPRGLRESAGDPRTGRAQAADRGIAPGKGGHPAAGGRPREHGDHLSEYPAPPTGRAEGAGDVPPKPDRCLPTGTRVEGEGLRAAQGAGIGRRPTRGRVPPRDEPGPRATAGTREAGRAPPGEGAPARRAAPRAHRSGGRSRTQTVGPGAAGERSEARSEGRRDDHRPIRQRSRRAEGPDGPARGVDGADGRGEEQAGRAAEGGRGGRKDAGGQGSPDRAARFEARGTRGEGEGTRSREGDPRARIDEGREAARRRGRGGPRRSQGPPQIEGRRERLASREGTTRQEGGGPRGEGGRAEEEGRRGGVPPGGAGPPDEGARGTRRGPLDRPRQARRGDTPRPRDNQGGGTDPREVARARSRGGRSPQDLAGSVGSSRGGTRTGTLRREKGPLQITP